MDDGALSVYLLRLEIIELLFLLILVVLLPWTV